MKKKTKRYNKKRGCLRVFFLSFISNRTLFQIETTQLAEFRSTDQFGCLRKKRQVLHRTLRIDFGDFFAVSRDDMQSGGITAERNVAAMWRDSDADDSTGNRGIPERLQTGIEADQPAVAEHCDADVSAVRPDQFTQSWKISIFDKPVTTLVDQAQMPGFCPDQQCAGFICEINRDDTVGKEIFKDFRRP